MEKVLNISNKDIRMKSTAGTLMRYRNNFGRDLIKDMVHLQNKLKKVTAGEEQFQIIELDMFEKIAWSMAKTADNTIPDIEHWLDNFETFDIMKVLPEIMQLLVDNLQQENESKKKLAELINK
ncbi:MAG: hypothetical protein IJX99_02175 [Clostridia bacterium]|nr:hypothetical protein [Clostridia bacterium]